MHVTYLWPWLGPPLTALRYVYGMYVLVIAFDQGYGQLLTLDRRREPFRPARYDSKL